jgi:hypothetical protein
MTECHTTNDYNLLILYFTTNNLHFSEMIIRGYDRQSSEQNNRKLISLHNNGEDDKHAHGLADF